MPTNANTFNSRVTSEALEAKFRQVFPAQGGAELVQDLFASGVIQPVIDFSTAAEGSFLAPNLQTAWDFSTSSAQVTNTTTTLISNTGFWKVDLTFVAESSSSSSAAVLGRVFIDDGTSTKNVWGFSRTGSGGGAEADFAGDNEFYVFLRAGDSLKCQSTVSYCTVDVWWRQVADVSGNLVNPLGFTFS